MAASRVVEVILRGKDGLSASLRSARRSLGSFGKFASGIAAGIGATFGAVSLGRFFASSVREAANAERSWAGLASAIRNVGQDANAVRPEVDRLVNSLALLSGKDDEAVGDAFSRLLTLTGDYRKAVGALPTVLDVAAARQIDLATAADLVGKAAIGNTATLARYGIVVREGADAMQVLRDRFNGFAAAEGQTLQGILGRINTAWGNLKEEVGRAIVGGEGFRGTANRIVASLVQMERWIRQNEGAISAFVTSAANGLGKLARAVGDLVVQWGNLLHPDNATAQPLLDRLNSLERERDVAAFLNVLGREKMRLTEEIAAAQERYNTALAEEARSRSDTPSEGFRKATADLTDLQAELAGVSRAFDAGSAKLQQMAKDAHDAATAIRGIAPASEAAVKVLRDSPVNEKPIARAAAGVLGKNGEVGAPGSLLDAKLPPVDLNITPKVDKDALAETTRKITEAVAKNDESLAEGYRVATDAVTAFGETFAATMPAVLAGNANIAQAIARGGRAAVASVASAKGQKAFVDAGDYLAEGIAEHDPSKFVAAAKKTAVGSAYMALAATLGGRGGAGGFGSAGGGGGGGLTPQRFERDRLSPQNTLTIRIQGGSARDPGLQDWLVETLKNAEGRGVTVEVA